MMCSDYVVTRMSVRCRLRYILAAVGFHPVCPGSTRYELTSPVFDEAVLKLDRKFYPGKKFVVKALNNSSRKCLYPKDLAERQTARPIVRFPMTKSSPVANWYFESGDTPNKSLGL